MTRSGQGDRTDADVGLLAEYLDVDRDLDEFVGIGAGLPYDDDVFLGTRVTLNDLAGTQLLAGAIVDRDDGSTAASLEACRRLTDVRRIGLEGNWFFNVGDDDVLRAIDNDDHVVLRLTRFSRARRRPGRELSAP